MFEFKKEWHKTFAYVILIVLFNIGLIVSKNYISRMNMPTARYIALGIFAILFLAVTIFTKVKNENTFLESIKEDSAFRQNVLFKTIGMIGILLITIFYKS